MRHEFHRTPPVRCHKRLLWFGVTSGKSPKQQFRLVWKVPSISKLCKRGGMIQLIPGCGFHGRGQGQGLVCLGTSKWRFSTMGVPRFIQNYTILVLKPVVLGIPKHSGLSVNLILKLFLYCRVTEFRPSRGSLF